MAQNPLIQTLGMFVGAYVAMNTLAKLSPLHIIVTVLAGILALIIWMARYNRTTLYALAQKPGLGPVIHAVCKVAHEQPPVDPSLDNKGSSTAAKPAEPEKPKLLMRSDGDFASGSRQLKEMIRGHNDVIEALMSQLRRNIQLRESSSVQVSLPPIGVFVFVGKPGLGKKSLATEVGYRLYDGSSVSILDVADPGVKASLLVGEARSNPYTSFIIENFQAASREFQEELLSIVAGAPQVDYKTGSKVSFRHCFFFLLVHRDASTMERPAAKGAGGTGQTMVVESFNATMEVDKRLGWSLHGIYPFVLPKPMEQAEVVAQILQKECKKYNLSLGRVDPAILAREVQVISTHGGFEITPSRVTKIASDRIADAVASKASLVDFGAAGTSQERYTRGV
jgi:hypothetical protein